jgi:hypothetical protein
MSVAQSRGGVMHFKNQHALIVKSKRLTSVEGPAYRAERRESHRADTDDRLSTEMNRS